MFSLFLSLTFPYPFFPLSSHLHLSPSLLHIIKSSIRITHLPILFLSPDFSSFLFLIHSIIFPCECKDGATQESMKPLFIKTLEYAKRFQLFKSSEVAEEARR